MQVTLIYIFFQGLELTKLFKIDCMPNGSHPTVKFLITLRKLFDNSSITFLWLPLHLASKDARTVRGRVELTFCWKSSMALDNSASHSSCIRIGQLKWRPLESCLKDDKQLSQSNKKLWWPRSVCTVNFCGLNVMQF